MHLAYRPAPRSVHLTSRMHLVVALTVSSLSQDPTAPMALARSAEPAVQEHWAFLPLRPVAPPVVQDPAWPRTPVDRFIRQAQETRGLSPNAPAAPRTLIRRLYFDLVGLPPTPEEMAQWSARFATPGPAGGRAEAGGAALDRSVVAQLVDTLLASAHYGERWARHWLDLARYADSDGQEGDADRPAAYRFRDFVIHALNNDLPYDTFVRWQIAGDELEPDNPLAIAATGFLVGGPSTELNVPMEEEKLRNRANELDDMVSTTGQALLALTLACARCHDHKYDPIPTKDYYRLTRIFNGGDRKEVPLATRAAVRAYQAALDAWEADSKAATQERDQWLKQARAPLVQQVRRTKIAKLELGEAEKRLLEERPDDPEAKKLANRFKKELKVEDADYVAALPDDAKARWKELDGRVKAVAARKPAPLPAAFAFADYGPEPRETWFFERGNFLARNERMDLGFLSVLTREKTPADYWNEARQGKRRDDSTQQRQALADWIVDRDHGAGNLLARVIVNRVWQHHFGEGLVRTPSDFGTRGERPTHPELLEWLSTEFVRSGWRLKALHRLILTSAVYLQNSTVDEAKTKVDPDNRLLWRQRPARLEAELLRDSMLAVAGTLNTAVSGPSFKAPIAAEAMQARNVKDPYPRQVADTPETRRRTIYMFHKRVVQYPLLQAFDAPDAQVSCGRRLNTTVAPQALALLNDAFVRLRAGELAARLELECHRDTAAQVRRAFELCLGRSPDAEETAEVCAFLARQSEARRLRESAQPLETAQRLALVDFCQSLFGLNEFIYVD